MAKTQTASKKAKKKDDYGLPKKLSSRKIAAPVVPYEPRDPKKYKPRIGLIACGGITSSHLKAYKAAGYNVVALCDLVKSKALKRQEEFYPKAEVYTDYRKVLERDDIAVVDVATHPPDRLKILEDALKARKHVLSQKPFVLDLAAGQRLVDLADKRGVKLAVNQNGRWAPHFSYIRNAIAQGVIGEVSAAHLDVSWNHNWVKGTDFEKVRHLILYDFAIHWFDILTQFMRGQVAKRVFASFAHSPAQRAHPETRAVPALLGQALLEYENAQATLTFDADTEYGGRDVTYVTGTKGSIRSEADINGKHTVTVYTAKGFGSPKLKGSWFPDGFHGTMGELLCAIEENREPLNSAQNNLVSLGQCFAAIASAETGMPQVPGKVKRPPGV